jgi:23S rRNA (cytidine1920-2'-O)/16S rRNA (cytidine1409-2'-O)-methyltransferase
LGNDNYGSRKVARERLDVLVVERGLVASREIARTAIMDGAVLVDGQKATKPGMAISRESQIEILPSFAAKKFASRGGFKLEKALASFGVLASDRICLDIGASTGGFTDCLLKSGARLVYAIDVGYGQLEWHLRQDDRVKVFERLNARNLRPEQIYQEGDQFADLAVMDVSFISSIKIFPALSSVLNPQTSEIVSLIKPQFEIGKERVGKGGVVHLACDHVEVIQHVMDAAVALKWVPLNLAFSPIKGPAGNIEFLMHCRRGENQLDGPLPDVNAIVSQAHAELNS